MNYVFVYALYSGKHNKIYIGRTGNIKARLASHFYFAKSGFTSRFRPWKLIYLEKCETVSQSVRREKQLKSARGRLFIRAQVDRKLN